MSPSPSGSLSPRHRPATRFARECLSPVPMPSRLHVTTGYPCTCGVIYSMKRFGHRPGLTDMNTPAVSYHSTLMRAVIFSRLLDRKLDKKSKYVGVFLPSSVGGAMTNFALSFLGRVPVNLNYTVGQEVLNSCIRQAGITQVLTSKLFLDKVGLKPQGEIIFVESLARIFGRRINFWPHRPPHAGLDRRPPIARPWASQH